LKWDETNNTVLAYRTNGTATLSPNPKKQAKQ
jgi:hypothetical protein